MADFLKLLLPLFSPTTYSEMLKKLASFLFYEVWIATYFLREIPTVRTFFLSIESSPPIKEVISLIPGNEKLNLTGLAIALLVAGISYAIQLHDRISDIFGIRRRFDQRHILLPLSKLVGVQLSADQKVALAANRDSVMREVFYKYASSRADKPVVDKHDIERALDGWSWFWFLVEGMAVTLVGALVALYFGARSLFIGFSSVFLLMLFASWLLSFKLRRLARPQIEAIAGNGTARTEVQSRFNAL